MVGMMKTIAAMVMLAVLFFGTVSVAHQHGKGSAHSHKVAHTEMSYEIVDGTIQVTFSEQPVGACDTTLQAYLIGDDGTVHDLGVITIVKDIAVEYYDEDNTTFGWWLPPIEGQYTLEVYVDSSCGFFGSDAVPVKSTRVEI